VQPRLTDAIEGARTSVVRGSSILRPDGGFGLLSGLNPKELKIAEVVPTLISVSVVINVEFGKLR